MDAGGFWSEWAEHKWTSFPKLQAWGHPWAMRRPRFKTMRIQKPSREGLSEPRLEMGSRIQTLVPEYHDQSSAAQRGGEGWKLHSAPPQQETTGQLLPILSRSGFWTQNMTGRELPLTIVKDKDTEVHTHTRTPHTHTHIYVCMPIHTDTDVPPGIHVWVHTQSWTCSYI